MHLFDRRVVDLPIGAVPLALVLYMLCHPPMDSKNPVLPRARATHLMHVRRQKPDEEIVLVVRADT